MDVRMYQWGRRLLLWADLLRQLVQLPDVQCAWLLLAFCAAPRAQHLLRNVPPADILPYARGHDDAVWAAVEGLLGDQGPGEGEDWAAARQRVSPAAYWAAWADALAVLRGRTGSALPTCSSGGGAPSYCRGLDEQTGVGVLRPVNSAWETQVGSDTPFSHFTLPFENA
ncbi:unnamed protein product, partial [Symbiodinium sp. KB8]